ncbi:longitudinals lacking protein isoform X3 [Drosophila elegans]|uniref:longitudinals lacking protein isoform X3 n=1 Tax=Drosophila elegans TaxID=30023 RepID=UPI0007E7C44D|nr:longitudinals lacking protein isoform X3 [Drosophila elegans]
MDDDQQFCLRWNNHQSTLISVFDTLLENETLVDCTLAAEGKFLKAHKVVLSACSPYFATLLQEQYDKHPIFILKDVKYQELRAMMDYMYRGEVNISQDQLAALLKAAESLQIKGLSDNRTGSGAAPKPESSHHRGGKLSGAYTLEQTKRARLATSGAMDTSGDVSGSREGSSSPSRRRRKVRRRSMENDAHDNSNSSVLQAASNQSILQQTGAGLPVSALVSTQLSSGPAAGTSSQASSTQQQQPLTSTNVTKKTESAKLTSSTAAPASAAAVSAAAVQQAHLQQAQTTSDAINTENVQAQSQGGAQGVQGDDEDMEEGSAIGGASAASGPNPASASASAVHAGVVVKQLASVVDKSSSNHKQKIKDNSVSSVGSEMVIEPKAEYDDDAHDENVEDLTLDEEDMTMEELDQTAGTSQGGEGSSQTYATWQHDRSQDELGLMAQDAQQRDPQDLSRKENTAPDVATTAEIQRSFQRSILNGKQRDEQKIQLPGSRRKRLSVTEVSDMLFEFYKTKSAKVPKQEQQVSHRQVSPTSGEILDPSTIPAMAVYGSASETASKNLNADEMMRTQNTTTATTHVVGAAVGAAASFHPRPKFTLKTAASPMEKAVGGVTAIPTSVLVANSSLSLAPKPQAAVIAEALMRNGLHSFQQQLRAQEILRHQTPHHRIKEENDAGVAGGGGGGGSDITPTKILENLLRKQQERDLRHSECENEPGYSTEDEDEGRYHAFDDIHLMEQGGAGGGGGGVRNAGLGMFHANAHGGSANSILEAHSQAFRNLEFTLSDYGGSSSNGSTTSPNGIGLDGEPVYECRHCGKKYRWKSTLRRHENVECGGKEPSHQCPYCPYKSKQRGNLGVHVRKHHTDLPQLPSKRRSKYSMKCENGMSGSMSDDSQGKLIIDFNVKGECSQLETK